MNYRQRKRLPHEAPLGIVPEKEKFFITICAGTSGPLTMP
jgi:hypothetical protein